MSHRVGKSPVFRWPVDSTTCRRLARCKSASTESGTRCIRATMFLTETFRLTNTRRPVDTPRPRGRPVPLLPRGQRGAHPLVPARRPCGPKMPAPRSIVLKNRRRGATSSVGSNPPAVREDRKPVFEPLRGFSSVGGPASQNPLESCKAAVFTHRGAQWERKYGVQSRPKLRVASRHRPCRSPPGVDGKSAHGMDGQAAIRSRFVPFPCRYGHQLAATCRPVTIPPSCAALFSEDGVSAVPRARQVSPRPAAPRPGEANRARRFRQYSRAWAWAKVGQTGARNGCASCRRRRVACAPLRGSHLRPLRLPQLTLRLGPGGAAPRRGTPQRALGSGYPTGSEQVVHTVRVQWPLAAICL